MHRPVVVVHGGAGRGTAERRARHVAVCGEAADAGLAHLERGGTALDAVQTAVEVMEASPELNAGRGSALTREGGIELDAALMEGTGLRAGAVCALPPFLHPIRVARAALEEGEHVLYAGPGAVELARRHGIEPCTVEELRTEAARRALRKRIAGTPWAGGDTVGAVVCDGRGHLAAAGSTGGTVGKRPGRVGDTPIPGAGLYADDGVGAVAATGDGEALLRLGMARTVLDGLAQGLDPDRAADRAVVALRDRIGGRGGVIVVTPAGRVGRAWSTDAMGYAIARPGEPTDAGC